MDIALAQLGSVEDLILGRVSQNQSNESGVEADLSQFNRIRKNRKVRKTIKCGKRGDDEKASAKCPRQRNNQRMGLGL